MEAEGSYGTKHGLAKGRVRLAAERLAVKGKAVTHTNVEAIYDPNTRKWVAEDFVGDCYGGRLLGSLEIGPTAPRAEEVREETRDLPASSGLEYVLRVAFNDVDLQQFLLADRSEDTEQTTEDRGQKTEEGAIIRRLSSVLRPPSSGLSSTSSGTMDAWLSLNARIGDDTRPGAPGEGAPVREPQCTATRRLSCRYRQHAGGEGLGLGAMCCRCCASASRQTTRLTACRSNPTSGQTSC